MGGAGRLSSSAAHCHRPTAGDIPWVGNLEEQPGDRRKRTVDSGFSNQEMGPAWAFRIEWSRWGPPACMSERGPCSGTLGWAGAWESLLGVAWGVCSTSDNSGGAGPAASAPWVAAHCPYPPGQPGVLGRALPSTPPVTHRTTGAWAGPASRLPHS